MTARQRAAAEKKGAKNDSAWQTKNDDTKSSATERRAIGARTGKSKDHQDSQVKKEEASKRVNVINCFSRMVDCYWLRSRLVCLSNFLKIHYVSITRRTTLNTLFSRYNHSPLTASYIQEAIGGSWWETWKSQTSKGQKEGSFNSRVFRIIGCSRIIRRYKGVMECLVCFETRWRYKTHGDYALYVSRSITFVAHVECNGVS